LLCVQQLNSLAIMATRDRQAAGSSSDDFAGQRRTQVQRRAHAEDALLDSAAKLFARLGVEQTSLAQVGAEAGYSRGLVNHHFGSKAVLVQRLVERSQHDFVSNLTETDGTEVDTAVTMARSYLSVAGRESTDTRAHYVMWGAALPQEADLRASVAAGDAQFRLGVKSLVRLGQKRRTIAAGVDPDGVAAVVVGMLRGTVAQFLIDPDDVDLAVAADTCEQFLRATLTPQTKLTRKRTG
jgi:AcrR family transcriptional regulator